MQHSMRGNSTSWRGLLLGLIAVITIPAAAYAQTPSRLGATLLPASARQAAQLAVDWRGEAAAQIDVTLTPAQGPAKILLANHAIASGMNLLTLPALAPSAGALTVDVHDASGHPLGKSWQGATPGAVDAVAAPAWDSKFFGPGLDNNVLATTIWDDGSGSALYVGGLFLTAGGHKVNHIARWDGSQWSALQGPSGIGLDGSVLALTVYDGALIVGGAFTNAGGVPANQIARWDGSAWSALGSGTAGNIATVDGLTVYQNALIAVGSFTQAGGVDVHGVGRWDGNAWSPLGLGLDSGTAFSAVEFNGDLIVGGNFLMVGGVSVNRIARWDGSVWSPLGAGVNSGSPPTVYALSVYGGALIAGGNFGVAGSVTVNRIARWDGSAWSALGSGLGSGTVYSLGTFGTDLVAGGNFSTASGISANNLARWNGTAWSVLDGVAGTGTDNQVRALAEFGGAVIVGGVFTRAGGIADNRIARWDGSDWSTLAEDAATGLNGQAFAAVVYDGALVVGGDFTSAGNLAANHIARWDGTAWSALGLGVGGGSTQVVNALTVYGTTLIVGGSFTSAGGAPAANIAQWDGTIWSALGSGVNSRVWSLGTFAGALIAGGQFSQAGGITVNNIARWDGTAWSTLAGATGIGANNRVVALTEFAGALIAAGNFTQAGGVSANYIARWDGSDWSALIGPSGNGVDNRLAALAVYDGALIVGGGFASAGGVPASNIARWDGTTWSALGDGLSGGCCAPWVRSLAVHDGQLVAGGIFTDAGGVAVNQIARWDGSAWSALPGPAGYGVEGSSIALGGGANTSVATLVAFDSDGAGPATEKLLAGGSFSLSGGVPNWGVAMFGVLDLTAAPDPLDFGSVLVGTTRGPLTVTLANNGIATITISALSDAGLPFASAGGSCAATPFTLAPGASCTLQYTFAPSSPGAASASVTIASDAASGARAFALTGFGAGSALSITPDGVDFGTLITGETGGPVSVTLTNAVETSIHVGSIGAALAPFALVGGSCGAAPFDLAPSASCTLAYTFSPTSGGDFSTVVSVASDAAGSPNAFTLQGSAQLRELDVSPNPLDFGAVAIGSASSASTLTLANTGVVDVSVSAMSALSAPFARTGGSCAAAPFTLAAGAACTLDIVFSPMQPGGATQSLTIASNAPSSPDAVTLQGSGTGAAITLDPTSLSVAVGQGHLDAHTLSIGNAGNQTLQWQVTQTPGSAGLLLRPLGASAAITAAPASTDTPADFGAASVAMRTQSSGAYTPAAGQTTLTQSTSFAIQSPSTVGCQPPSFGQPPYPTAKESFYRVFKTSDFGINTQFDVSEVTFGIEQLNVTADLSVNLYLLHGALAVANLTQIGSVTQTFSAQSVQLVTVPVSGSVPAGATLVVEIAAPAMSGNGIFLAGSNNLGQSGPSYVNSFGQCSVSDITDYAALGQPNIDLVMSVTGTPVSCALPAWVSVAPPSGSVLSGQSDDVEVSFDARTLAAGDYSANLCVASNDPLRPLAIVPLSMNVAALPAFTVTPSAGPGGSISPSTPQSIDQGYAATFTLTPDAGHHIDSIGGTCGGTLSGNVYTTAPVTADCTVAAAFAIDTLVDVVSGSPQSAEVATPFAAPLVVRVATADGVAVAGATVDFTLPAQGPSASMATSATTDANGEVSLAATANTVAGSYVVSASVAGAATSAQFALTNTAAAPSRLVPIQGDAQSASVRTAFALPLAVQVRDAWNNPVAGTPIDFAAPASGASATLSAGSAVTDANGVASVSATANDVTGSYVVNASTAAIAPVGFTLSNTSPVVALGISIDDRRDYTRYGQLLDYVVTVRNSGTDVARGVDVAAVLPAQVDATQASWICLSAGSGACTPSGSGALADSGATIPANASIAYLMSVPVRADASGDAVVTSASTSSADDAIGADSSDTDVLVLFRDGFDAGGVGAAALALVPASWKVGDPITLALPADHGPAPVDILLSATAADRSGFRIERLQGAQTDSVRVVVVGSDNSERATRWTALPAGASALDVRVLDKDGVRTLHVAGAGAALILPLASAPPDYRVQVVAANETH